jgi:hypothetical protein
MKKTLIISSMALGCLTLAAGLVFASSGGTPQASITLQNSDAKYCYTHNDTWTLTKDVTGNTVDASTGTGTVTWTVTATKDSSQAATFTVHGGLTVTNTGTAPATIGNIVVNLQKPNSPKQGSNAPYVSIAADVADATNGDAATSAKIVAAGSQENVLTNAAWGTNNYTVTSAQGTFTETAGKSGSLEFKDASNNSVWAISPQQTIAVGASVTLLYDATFDISVLPAAGTQMRVEALVSFGNAGLRGGSGSTGMNIDINGNGTLQPDEANVRTVPSRVALAALTAPGECNASVTVTDIGATVTGTVTTGNPVGFDAFPATISDTTSWNNVSVDVNGGALGGKLCNDANLVGADCGGTLSVIVGYQDPPSNTIPIYATYLCFAAATADASACVDIGPPQGFQNDDYCTYTKGGYAGIGDPGQIYNNNFLSVFSSGLTIGINNNAATAPYDAMWTATATGSASLKTYLTSSASGPNGALTVDTINATSTSGGNLPRQTATLALNIGFNAAGLNGTHINLGSLTLCNLVEGSTIGSWTLTAAQATALNGRSISQVLADANNALAGNGLPAYVDTNSFGELNQLVTALNESFEGCNVTSFATAYLCSP